MKAETAPTLPDCLMFFWQAYGELSSSKNANGLVPISEIESYCNIFGIEDKEVQCFLLKIVSSLSFELLDYREKKSEVERRMERLKQKTGQR